jgi:hypothetical protein
MAVPVGMQIGLLNVVPPWGQRGGLPIVEEGVVEGLWRERSSDKAALGKS